MTNIFKPTKLDFYEAMYSLEHCIHPENTPALIKLQQEIQRLRRLEELGDCKNEKLKY